jgi:hypothetical protein
MEGGGGGTEKDRGRTCPVKGMGDPETEEIIDTDKRMV